MLATRRLSSFRGEDGSEISRNSLTDPLALSKRSSPQHPRISGSSLKAAAIPREWAQSSSG